MKTFQRYRYLKWQYKTLLGNNLAVATIYFKKIKRIFCDSVLCYQFLKKSQFIPSLFQRIDPNVLHSFFFNKYKIENYICNIFASFAL